ncbi:peptidase S8 and S53 subtilisin kexin sedolisin [Fischerella major NIES-592]|uniref:Peptidase S8 and S53 subtilisin kexin sedolisin n=1 Tax=Fischerella major NIES-592 TaxID=210994 RepID=A0A1U7H571_9CYAN|nr:S8 family serine peptidase [Fischerella major]OKH16366.1 peptidase S8 and S53 subtilisin kexin sedolisin [Fischerella major NIES-592]
MSSDLAGNSLDKARSFTFTNNSEIFTDRVSLKDQNDYYQFTLEGRSSFQLDLTRLSANANVQLIRDVNGNGLVDKGEVIAASKRTGKKAESITTILEAGTYHIRVYSQGKAKTKYDLSVSATPIDNAGNTLNAAWDIGEISANTEAISYTDWVGKSDSYDYYKFNINTAGDVTLSLKDLGADADMRLLNWQGEILAGSANITNTDEFITSSLTAGTYYVEIYPYNGNQTFYNLRLSFTPPDSTVMIQSSDELESVDDADSTSITPATVVSYQGTLRADTFVYTSTSTQTVFSGKGNIDFGSGGRDILDLSAFVSTQVQAFNYAHTANGGVVYDPGDSVARVFDAIAFSDGKQIFFEGIDTIKFADTIIDLSVIPNDPLFNQQWNLHMMDVHKAWRFTTGSDQILLGIEDTGIATDINGYLHPDLRFTESISSNYFDEYSSDSHGTLVQGAIAAASNNNIGIAGINWNSALMHVDVVGGNPGDYSLADATQILINWADSQNKRLVINLSLSGGYSTAFEQLIANNQDDVLFVIAAGNGNQSTISSPADLAKKYQNVISVGACWGTQDYYGNPKTPGTRVDYPSAGIQWYGSNYGEGLTLMAPAEFTSTSATRNTSNSFYSNFDYINYFSGTSAATANVTGIASLVWSVNQGLTATQIRSILSEAAYDLGDPGYDIVHGYGVVNTDAAVRRALAIART